MAAGAAGQEWLWPGLCPLIASLLLSPPCASSCKSAGCMASRAFSRSAPSVPARARARHRPVEIPILWFLWDSEQCRELVFPAPVLLRHANRGLGVALGIQLLVLFAFCSLSCTRHKTGSLDSWQTLPSSCKRYLCLEDEGWSLGLAWDLGKGQSSGWQLQQASPDLGSGSALGHDTGACLACLWLTFPAGCFAISHWGKSGVPCLAAHRRRCRLWNLEFGGLAGPVGGLVTEAESGVEATAPSPSPLSGLWLVLCPPRS